MSENPSKAPNNEAPLIKDFLTKNKDEFLRLRKVFGIGPELGFATIIEVHDGLEANGCVIKAYEEDGQIWVQLTQIMQKRYLVKPKSMIVRPQGSEKYIVSIFPLKGVLERLTSPQSLDSDFLQDKKKELTGLLAHEMAEYLLHFKAELIPEEFCKKIEEYDKNPNQGAKDQSRADLLAALFGFKEDVLNYLNWYRERKRLEEDFPGGTSRPPRDQIEELTARINFLETPT